MISTFSILFITSILSLALHRSIYLKPFVLIALAISMILTFSGSEVGLIGFSTNETIKLFELILELVLFAVVLHEDEDITITQTMFIATASILLLQSDTLMSFIISFEAIGIISLVLVSYIKTKDEADGAVKMFIASGIATAILFLGVVFYLMGGGALLEPIATTTNIVQKIGIIIIFISLFYKLTIVPFHGWASDAYALVKNSHASLLSGVVKSVVVVSVFKIFAPFFTTNFELTSTVFMIFAIITMTLGNFMALFTKKLSSILSYSSIAHAGYMLLVFVAIKSSFAKDGVLYIAIAYIFMQTSAFLVLDILKKHYKITTLEELAGFSKVNHLVSLFFTLELLSLAGIPLLAGFLAKAVVFYSVVDAGFYYIALIALLNSALSVGYYVWIIKAIYFDDTSKEKQELKLTMPLMAQTILACGTLYFGIFAGVVFK